MLSKHLAEAGNWLHLVQPACAVLCRTSADELTAISVTGRLDGASEEAQRLLVLCRRLAEEYRLQELVSLAGGSFTVRFSRPAPAPRAACRRAEPPGRQETGQGSKFKVERAFPNLEP